MKSSTFLHILAVLIAYWVIVLYQPFLIDIAIAALLALATANIHQFISKIIPIRSSTKNHFIASVASTLFLAIVLFGPILYFIISLSFVISDISPLLHAITQLQNFVDANINHLPRQIAFLKPKIDQFISDSGFRDSLLNFSATLGKNTVIFLWDIALILTFYFFTHIYGKEIANFVIKVSPLEKTELSMMFNETAQVMGVVFYSSIVTAVFEGFLFGLIAWYIGYDGIFWGILYGFASLIPVVGGVILWGPLALHQLSLGHTHEAWVIALYSLIVISIIADTFIKPLIIDFINSHFVKKPTEINSLLIFFSIIAGLGAYGFWGMILGPATTALFISVLKIYSHLKMLKNSDALKE